jgi:hypothetical protein
MEWTSLSSIERVIQLITMKRLPTSVSKDQLAAFAEPRFEIDVHEMFVDEALHLLRNLIRHAPPQLEQIHVIHGYRSGQALQQAITKNNLRSKRIHRVRPAMNPGVSVIELHVEEPDGTSL